MIDLNTRIKHAPPGLVLTDAIAISDTGAIVADSNVGLVLLKPSAHGADAPVVEPVGRHGCRHGLVRRSAQRCRRRSRCANSEPVRPACRAIDRRLTYQRPYADNSVKQLDTKVPARKPLMDWLAGLTLNMTEGQSIKVFGESMIVTLPCGKLDL